MGILAMGGMIALVIGLTCAAGSDAPIEVITVAGALGGVLAASVVRSDPNK